MGGSTPHPVRLGLSSVAGQGGRHAGPHLREGRLLLILLLLGGHTVGLHLGEALPRILLLFRLHLLLVLLDAFQVVGLHLAVLLARILLEAGELLLAGDLLGHLACVLLSHRLVEGLGLGLFLLDLGDVSILDGLPLLLLPRLAPGDGRLEVALCLCLRL